MGPKKEIYEKIHGKYLSAYLLGYVDSLADLSDVIKKDLKLRPDQILSIMEKSSAEVLKIFTANCLEDKLKDK